MMIIKSICGVEPCRQGDDPEVWAVGYDGVTRIEQATENLGTYGITWFEAYAEDKLVAKMNALHVASVRYQ